MFWAIASGAALAYWVLSIGTGHPWWRTAVKGLAVAPLAVLALIQAMPIVALALILCSLGDMVLSRPGKGAFLGGLIAFALGHLVWIAVFFLNVSVTPEVLVEPVRVLFLCVLAVLALFMTRTLIPRAKDLKGPVAAYIIIIVAMGVAALATSSVTIIAGALLFAASDTLLGLQTFVLAGGTRQERMANALIWPLYWLAIAFLTIGSMV